MNEEVIKEQIEAISSLTRIPVNEIKFKHGLFIADNGRYFEIYLERGGTGRYIGEIGPYIVKEV